MADQLELGPITRLDSRRILRAQDNSGVTAPPEDSAQAGQRWKTRTSILAIRSIYSVTNMVIVIFVKLFEGLAPSEPCSNRIITSSEPTKLALGLYL